MAHHTLRRLYCILHTSYCIQHAVGCILSLPCAGNGICHTRSCGGHVRHDPVPAARVEAHEESCLGGGAADTCKRSRMCQPAQHASSCHLLQTSPIDLCPCPCARQPLAMVSAVVAVYAPHSREVRTEATGLATFQLHNFHNFLQPFVQRFAVLLSQSHSTYIFR